MHAIIGTLQRFYTITKDFYARPTDKHKNRMQSVCREQMNKILWKNLKPIRLLAWWIRKTNRLLQNSQFVCVCFFLFSSYFRLCSFCLAFRSTFGVQCFVLRFRRSPFLFSCAACICGLNNNNSNDDNDNICYQLLFFLSLFLSLRLRLCVHTFVRLFFVEKRSF